MVMKEYAYAKINLQLNILGKRPDGYHELDMIMQTVGLRDVLQVETVKTPGIVLESNYPELDTPNNLICRAARILAGEAHIIPHLHIKLVKNIFVAAGLAGGSADAAATFRVLNRLWKLNYSVTKLEELAGRLGSDIPFLIAGGTSRCQGRGEILTELPRTPARRVVLAKPRQVEVSTAWAYGAYDRLRSAVRQQHQDNDLELVTVPAYPVIEELKRSAYRAGASLAMMSGSGPSVFALANTEAEQQQILKAWSAFDADVVATKYVGRMI